MDQSFTSVPSEWVAGKSIAKSSREDRAMGLQAPLLCQGCKALSERSHELQEMGSGSPAEGSGMHSWTCLCHGALEQG